jgi:endonuclease-3 related protein
MVLMLNTRTTGKHLQDIYQRLMDAYGPQHWWPAEEPFEVMVGAILTQSAAWLNVEKAIANLKAAKALSPQALRRFSRPEIASLIRPSGYYNAKALKLKSLAQWLGEYCHDDLSKLFANSTDQLRPQLLSVYGIGEETADSIILYAANKPIFVIDAYTRRIINRVGLAPDSNSYTARKPVFVIDAYTRRIISRLGLAPDGNSYTAYQALFMDNLPADAGLFNEYHALLVCLGKYVCRNRPLCQQCCLQNICHFSTDG